MNLATNLPAGRQGLEDTKENALHFYASCLCAFVANPFPSEAEKKILLSCAMSLKYFYPQDAVHACLNMTMISTFEIASFLFFYQAN